MLILKEFEETLLDMPFEIMLIQIVNLPQKYLIHKFPDSLDEVSKQAYEAQEIARMD